MKPSYIVNIIFYIHLSLSFSHSASRSLTHPLTHDLARTHTFALMLTIFFNLPVQLIVLQCKRIYSINQNLNGSCDQFFDHVPTKFIFNANHLLLFFIRNYDCRGNKKKTTQEIIHQFKQNHSETLIHTNI